MRIVGTAGHVDHGKSALVAALTGTDPDRWAQEQLRGMTLDLGFAHLVLRDGLEAGIVDVPGHERFLHNMLAGAAGMDVLLLVVAANEGVMPQTLEHLQILRYLNVARTIVTISKIDLVPQSERDARVREIAEALRGTLAEHAAVAAVSSVTGEGLDELRELVAAALSELAPRDPQAPVYLPVDRAFTLPGIGTVVTGTLMQGSVAPGDSLTLEPNGERVRVRSVHVFGAARDRAQAGARVALNLPGIERAQVARGKVVVSSELGASANARVRFTPAAGAVPLLRRRTPVRAYVGAAEILGTLVFERLPAAGEEVEADLHLREPTVLFRGVRFVVRRPSPKSLLGGGAVSGIGERGAGDGAEPIEEALLAVLRERGLDPVPLAALATAVNAREEIAGAAIDALVGRSEAIAVARPQAYVDAGAAHTLLGRTLEHLEELHRSEPWSLGATSIALARVLGIGEPLLVRILGAFADEGRIANRGGYYAATEHRPRLSPEQHALFDALVAVDPERPALPVPFDAVVSAVRQSRVTGAVKALDTLFARGVLVKVGDDVYRGAQIERIVARVEAYLHERERMTAAEFRDLLGTSRKYAVPLLEWLDARGITVRNGDHRMLRKRAT